MSRQRGSVTLLVLVAVLCVSSADGDIITPPGLNPGDPFRLAFVSSTAPELVSNEITDYDAYIQGLADAAGLGIYGGGAVTWQVIGSTAAVNANDAGRLPITDTVPFYLVDGSVLVDGGAADLWDGSIDHTFNITETGVELIVDHQVATGTLPDGSAAADPLGLTDLAVGHTSHTASSWVYFTENGIDGKRHYGVSQILTVPTAIPEPMSAVILVAAVGSLLCRRRARDCSVASQIEYFHPPQENAICSHGR